MYRRIMAMLLCMVFLFSRAAPARAAEGNMDGEGGGGLDGTTGDSGWNDGFEGVRVSVIEKRTRKTVGVIVDWINFVPPTGVKAFTKKNKLQYLAGGNLAPIFDEYVYKTPSIPLPNIISSDGSSNIAAVKAYFCDEIVIKQVAKHVSISYDTLISGDFTILIEPLAVVRYNGARYALTATEAALYDRMLSGGLREKLGFLTHQNMPLCMYLETQELGIRPGGGAGPQPNDYIISTLGIGTVNFDGGEEENDDEEAPPEVYDAEYRADTDVVTAITVSTSSEINPDAPGTAAFDLPGGGKSREYVIPRHESQLVWVKWRTPKVDTVTHYDVPVSVSRGSGGGTIRIKVTPITENTPPNPLARDRNDGFALKTPPAENSTGSLTWGEWWASWDEDDDEWDFHWSSYSASLSATVRTMPDERVPTAAGGVMKSGYGINAEVSVTMTTDGGSSNTTAVQHVIATFPEFDFQTYNRWLIPEGGSPGYIKKWAFKPNEYSQFNNPVHFTPIWYPDRTLYPVSFTVLDAWTPAGQLQYVLTASDITIEGNAYDDWHIAPGFGTR